MCSEQGLQVTSLSSKKESAKLDEYLNYIGKYYSRFLSIDWESTN